MAESRDQQRREEGPVPNLVNQQKKRGLKGSSETLPGDRHKAKVSGGGLQTGHDGWGQQGQGWRPGGEFRQERWRP